MNKTPFNIAGLDGGGFIKEGGGGGVTINNQEKSLDISENGVTEVTADAGFTGLSKVVVNTNVQSGGAPVSKPVNNVNFYDYDGTILHSYTKEEFLAMSALPPLPEREGLICQEWNWTYEEAQEYVAEYGLCDIGATYITDDGKTRLYVRFADNARTSINLYFRQTKANGVTINWGDGSADETLSAASYVNTSHKYAEKGDYIITLDPADGCTLRLGHDSRYYGLLGELNDYWRYNSFMLKRVELGRNVKFDSSALANSNSLTAISIPKDVGIGQYGLYRCESLETLVIPNGIAPQSYALQECSALKSAVYSPSSKDINSYGLYGCKNMTSFVIPKGVTSIGTNAFQGCRSLASIVIPKGVTSIEHHAFNGCYSLASIVIPKGVTKFDSNTFSSCSGMVFYDFSEHTSIPSLNNINSFSSIPSDCKIIVPDALYDEWIAATNWSTYASNIIKKSDWDAQS